MDKDVEFLREQVQRLNVVLSQYQKKYLPLGQEDEAVASLLGEGPPASWLTDRRLLAPLLVEYDRVIGEMITTHQSELASLTDRTQQIIQENTRLHSELRQNLESKPQFPAAEDTTSTMVESLQKQLGTVSKERDSYVQIWKQMSQELEHIERSEQEKAEELLRCKTQLVKSQQVGISSQQVVEELQCTCHQLDRDHQQCLKTVQSQEKELTTLQEDLSQCKTKLKAANIKNSELKKTLDDITLQLKRRDAEQKRAEDFDQSLDDRVHLLHVTNADLEGKLLAAQREAALLKDENTGLEGTLASLQSKVSTLEQREYEAILHVKESMQLVENAIIEKEQAQICEKQHAHEIVRLKKAMSTLLLEAGERTRKEVAAVRRECNQNIDKMAEEIEKLEVECSEWQVQVERVQREGKTVEKELERVLAQGPLEQVRAGDTLHELQTRVCVAERARDEALVKLESESASRRRLEASLVEEKCASEQVAEEHHKWQRLVREECQQLREQRIKLIRQCDELRQQLRTGDQAKEAIERRLAKEVSVLTQRHELREKELLFQLDSSEEAHQRSVQDLRELLAAQHKVGTRWREESMALTHKFERTTAELRDEIMQHKRRNEELILQLNNSKLAREEFAKQLGILTSGHKTLQHQLREAESQTEAAASHISVLLSRERQLLGEQKALHRLLDRLRLERARSAGVCLPLTGEVDYTDGTMAGGHPMWNDALHHSISQGLGPGKPNRSHFKGTQREYHCKSHRRVPSPERGSEQSLLSPGDLSQTSSHSTAIQS